MTEQEFYEVVPIATAWTTLDGYDPCQKFGISAEQAAAYDVAFRLHAIRLAQRVKPDLIPFLAELGVRYLAVGPQAFQFTLEDGATYNVPELEAHLSLMPWREPGEATH